MIELFSFDAEPLNATHDPSRGSVKRPVGVKPCYSLRSAQDVDVVAVSAIGQRLDGGADVTCVDDRLADTGFPVDVRPREGLIATILHRGIERGELRDDIDVELAAAALLGTLLYRYATRRGDDKELPSRV